MKNYTLRNNPLNNYSSRNDAFQDEKRKAYSGIWLNKPIALTAALALTPLFLTNSITSKIKRKPLLIALQKKDALGRNVITHQFSSGLMKNSAILFDIIRGKLSFCGASTQHRIDKAFRHELLENYNIPSGIFSLYDIYASTGLADKGHSELLKQQVSGSSLNFITLLLKSILCRFFYQSKNKELGTPSAFTIFGIRIDNIKMKSAVKWILEDNHQKTAKIGFFVNVNSVNLSSDNPQLKEDLLRGDKVFADGSGVRLAAKHIGVKLKDNVNGTDLLPHLCKAAAKSGDSFYFVGSDPGVAESAAQKLVDRFPSLRIVGCQHGYFNKDRSDHVIDHINQASPDILLVAMGSPAQERWVIENANKLNCKTVLAVGGLLDFYSGKIPRAPLWMREIGMEWVWRLLQEPKSKFNRYVIGNPLFLFRTFILNQA